MAKNIVQDVVALSWLQREERRNEEGSVTDEELKKYIDNFRKNTLVLKAGYNEKPQDLSKYNIQVITNRAIYRGYDIYFTSVGFDIILVDALIHREKTDEDDASKKYKAMQKIDSMHRELQKQINTNIQRVDAQVKK
tara:strand:- start:63 stop:473 length:411 start_codon:yes stop_codon:yes gene_type:complete